MHLPRKTYSAFVERQAQSKPPRAIGTRGGGSSQEASTIQDSCALSTYGALVDGGGSRESGAIAIALFIGVSVSPILFKLSQHLFVAHALKQAQFSYRQCSPDAVSVTVVLAHPYR